MLNRCFTVQRRATQLGCLLSEACRTVMAKLQWRTCFHMLMLWQQDPALQSVKV